MKNKIWKFFNGAMPVIALLYIYAFPVLLMKIGLCRDVVTMESFSYLHLSIVAPFFALLLDMRYICNALIDKKRIVLILTVLFAIYSVYDLCKGINEVDEQAEEVCCMCSISKSKAWKCFAETYLDGLKQSFGIVG